MTDTGGEPERQGRRRRGWAVFLRDLVVILVIALAVSWVLKTYLIRSFYIPSASMENTLLINDRIIVNELVPDVMRVKHGDVVVFKDPGGWLESEPKRETNWAQDAGEWVLSLVGLAAPDSDDHLIKRVIGLPGDTVECCTATGHLTVNGVPLDEPYILIPEGYTDATVARFQVTVPADSLWVMGDNRYNSRDSLAHINEPSGGFVPMGDVVGKALVISLPVGRWAVLDNYPATFQGVEENRPADGLGDRRDHAGG